MMTVPVTDRVPAPHELPHKPLVEAICEVRWELMQENNEQFDPGFQLLLGRFYDKVSRQFPEFENLPVAQVPETIAPFAVRHRFRAKKNGWPLIQLGPGIMTVNETEGYSWKTFKPMLQMAVEALFAAYPTNVAKLAVSQVTLRYINGIPLNVLGEAKNIRQFLQNHLHTKIDIDRLLFENPDLAGNPGALNLRLLYPLQTPKGLGALSLSSGMRDNKPSVIWENMVVSGEGHVPKEPAAFDSWFDEAHTMTDRWFFALCRGSLLTEFGGKNV